MNKLLAINGIIGSGKDTVVSIIKMHIALSKLYNHIETNISKEWWLKTAIEKKDITDWCCDLTNISIDRFAMPLKAIIAAFCGCSIHDLNSQEFKKECLDPSIWYSLTNKQLTIRDLHTDISDAIKNCINNDIFAITCIERCKKSKSDIVIINDLRYPSEMDLCIRNNAYIIRIQRPEAERERNKQLYNGNIVHSSEMNDIDNELFNIIIRNDSTYEDLSIRIVDALNDAQLVNSDYTKWYKNY